MSSASFSQIGPERARKQFEFSNAQLTCKTPHLVAKPSAPQLLVLCTSGASLPEGYLSRKGLLSHDLPASSGVTRQSQARSGPIPGSNVPQISKGNVARSALPYFSASAALKFLAVNAISRDQLSLPVIRWMR